jgi:metallo-beta-lactamase class B
MHMMRTLKGLASGLALLAFAPWAGGLPAQPPARPADQPCSQCAVWNVPQKPFKVYGNTYYVGTHGLSSILIQTDAGLVLIDGALSDSAQQIIANIRSLGFKPEDIEFIFNTHVHYDHAGGIAELQRLSHAEVLASPWTAHVMQKGVNDPADPQYASLPPIAPVANVHTLHDGEVFHLGKLAITAHSTPGHTPGGTSWTWKSCEDTHCLNMVYTDSLSPVSSDGYKFTHNPQLMEGFAHSFHFLNNTPCDILLTPHPEVSNLWDRLAKREQGVKPDPMIDPTACKRLADQSREALNKRIATETASTATTATH